jgi:hypothetical protein
MVTVGGIFSDAYIGWGVGGWNALNLMPLSPTFRNNDIAIGHDREHGDADENDVVGAGYGTWNLFGATIEAESPPDPNPLAMDPVIPGPYYALDLHSASPKLLQETTPDTNGSHYMIFDKLDLDDGKIEMGQGGAVVFMGGSDLGQETVSLQAASGHQPRDRAAFKLNSTALDWGSNSVPPSPIEPDESIASVFELELCATPSCPVGCQSLSSCSTTATGDTKCLDTDIPAWIESPCEETLVRTSCPCRPVCGAGQVNVTITEICP